MRFVCPRRLLQTMMQGSPTSPRHAGLTQMRWLRPVISCWTGDTGSTRPRRPRTLLGLTRRRCPSLPSTPSMLRDWDPRIDELWTINEIIMINILVWFTITNNELNLLRSLQSFYYFSVVMLLWRHKFKRIIRCCVKMSSRYTETVTILIFPCLYIVHIWFSWMSLSENV